MECNEMKQDNKRARATISGPGDKRSFDLRNTWMPVDVVVLDDGTLLCFDKAPRNVWLTRS